MPEPPYTSLTGETRRHAPLAVFMHMGPFLEAVKTRRTQAAPSQRIYKDARTSLPKSAANDGSFRHSSLTYRTEATAFRRLQINPIPGAQTLYYITTTPHPLLCYLHFYPTTWSLYHAARERQQPPYLTRSYSIYYLWAA